MGGQPDYTVLSLSSVEALSRAEHADFELYLPGQSGDAPVLYRPSDSKLSAPDFKRLAENGLARIMVRTDSFDQSAREVESKLDSMLTNPHISPTDKAEIFHTVGSTVARDLVSGSITPDQSERAAKVVESMIAHVLDDVQVASHLLQMAGHERSTASHMFFVSTFAIILGAQAFGEDETTLRDLGFAGMLHDIGKLSIPHEVLNKPGKLTRAELHYVQQHPIESVRLIGDDPQVSARARQMILQHHERLDGRGYPLGLRDAELLPESKALSIVDSFHAMIGARRYRAPMTPADALRVLAAQSGKQFDGAMVEQWRQVFGQFYASTWNSSEFRDVPEDELSPHHEHRPSAPPPMAPKDRPKRHLCENRAVVRCRYAGRLINATCAPDDFGAPVRDISQSGICINASHPMYRGEVLHLRVPVDNKPAWIRGAVAWCASTEGGTFRIGVRFIERIEEEHSTAPTEVVAMSEMTPAPGAEDDETDRPATHAPPNKQKKDMETLAAIDCMGRPNMEAQATAVTLAMSGDREVRLRAVEVLANMGTATADKGLIALLEDGSPDIRERAVMAISGQKSAAAARGLKALLNDPVERIAIRAAGALGRLGDKSGLSKVISALRHDGPASRLAAKAFGEITGHNYAASAEGVRAARRYLKAKKSLFASAG